MFPRRWASGLLLCLAALVASLLAAGPSSADYATPGGGGDITPASIAANSSEVIEVSAAPPTYDIMGNLTISAGDTLVLGPSATLRFSNFTSLTVLGGLRAHGNASARVAFQLRPSGSPDLSAWQGLYADAPASFELRNATLSGLLDITYWNGAGAVLDNVTYQGRLTLESSTGARLSRLLSTALPFDTGRPPLWVFNSTDIEIRDGDLEGGYGWGDIPSFHIFQSTGVRAWNMTMRADSFQIEGMTVERSSDVVVLGLHVRPGPGGGVPGPALEAIGSTDVWVEGISIDGAPLLGPLYGTDSNVTIANSSLTNYTAWGDWSGAGRLVAVNVSGLSVGASGAGQVWDYRLVRVAAAFSSGGPVRAGNATMLNASNEVRAAVVNGTTGWSWVLGAVNRSGSLNLSLLYAVEVECNCTPGSGQLDLTGAAALVVSIAVGDTQPPDPVAIAIVGLPGSSILLVASESRDNDAIANFSWTTAPGVVVAGLPCTLAACEVTFLTPGNHSITLTLKDRSGNAASTSVVVYVADTVAPLVSLSAPSPARPGQGQPFGLSVAASDNDPSFLPAVAWYLDGVAVSSSSLNQTFFTDSVGNHTVRVVVTDAAGNAGAAQEAVYVFDSTPPSITSLGSNASLQAGDQAFLDSRGRATDNVGIVSWHWRVQGPSTDYGLSGPVVNATFPAAGTYLVSLSVSDAEGNTANRSFEVMVGAAAAAPDDLPLWVALGVVSVAALVGGTLVLRRSRRV